MLSLWVIRRSLHIDKIHKNNNSFLIIPTLSSKTYCVDIIAHFRSQQKENSSEIPAHGSYRSVKLFLQPIKLFEISIMIRSWNYCAIIYMSQAMRKRVLCHMRTTNVSISKEFLKCQRVMISDMPNWGDKVIRRYSGCTLQTFVKHYNSTISPPFFQRFSL